MKFQNPIMHGFWQTDGWTTRNQYAPTTSSKLGAELPKWLHMFSEIWSVRTGSMTTHDRTLGYWRILSWCCPWQLFLSIKLNFQNDKLLSKKLNSSHAVRGLSRVRQYPPWLLFATFVEFVGYPRYNPQKTRKQWRTRDRRFHWLWGWFPDLKIIFMM